MLPSSMKSLTGKPIRPQGMAVRSTHLHEIKALLQAVCRFI